MQCHMPDYICFINSDKPGTTENSLAFSAKGTHAKSIYWALQNYALHCWSHILPPSHPTHPALGTKIWSVWNPALPNALNLQCLTWVKSKLKALLFAPQQKRDSVRERERLIVQWFCMQKIPNLIHRIARSNKMILIIDLFLKLYQWVNSSAWCLISKKGKVGKPEGQVFFNMNVPNS